MRLGFLKAVLCAILVATPAGRAEDCTGHLLPLSCGDALLVSGQASLNAFRVTIPSFTELLAVYPPDRAKLASALQTFSEHMNVHGQEGHASSGLRESLTWLLKGQALLGNDHLQTALGRLRFPPDGGIAATIEQEIAELEMALVEYEMGTTYFSLLLTDPSAPSNGNLVELGRLLFRKARARLEKSNRLYALGVRSPTRRGEAETELRRSVQESYMGAVVLAAFRSEEEIAAIVVGRHKGNAEQALGTFSKIAEGVSPGGFHNSYIPYFAYKDCDNENESQRAIAAKYSGPANPGALHWDVLARQTTRQVDQNEDALRADLASLRNGVIAELDQLSGGLTNQFFSLGQNLEDAGVLEAFITASRDSFGTLAQAIEDYNAAQASLEAAFEGLRNVPRKIEIEQGRAQQTATVLLDTGEQLAALEVAKGFANAFTTSCSCCFPPGCSVTFSPGAIIGGILSAEGQMLQTMQQVRILNIDTAATVKLFMLELAERAIALREFEARTRQAGLVIRNTEERIRALIDEYQQTLANNATAFYRDPGYRLEMEFNVERAHLALRRAQRECYLACQAISYEWAVPFTGAVLPDADYNEFIDCDSVFELNTAQGVADFFDALDAWDSYNRGHLGPTGSVSQTEVSVRRQILGFSGGSEEENRRLFREFIRSHREGDLIEFEFATTIADQFLFPIFISGGSNYVNVRIEAVAADLFGAELVQGPTNIGRLGLTIGGMSTIRQFGAGWRPGPPVDARFDRLAQYDLEELGRLESTGGDERFRTAALTTTINTSMSPENRFNSELARVAVAASKWRVTIDTQQAENRNLNFDALTDIRFRIRWKHGHPKSCY